jgi:hypothetical protein
VPIRPWFLATIEIAAIVLFPRAITLAQQEPATADQVLTKYMEAIGANRFPSITTLVESGDLDGNLPAGAYRPSSSKDHGTFESYYKSPNLRFDSSITDKGKVIGLNGCDGKIGWYIDATLKRTEFTPKPESPHVCEGGYKPPLFRLRDQGVKLRLLGKKELEGRAAWAIKADFPKSSVAETFYFDAETFLLLRSTNGYISTTFSDYRDVSGMKFPFKMMREFSNSKLITSVRELEINVPIDDGRFAEPQPKNGTVSLEPPRSTTQENVQKANSSSPETVVPANTTISDASPPQAPAAISAPGVVEVNAPNFTTCPMADLQLAVPELKGLKPAANQEKLGVLLRQVGAKTMEIDRNTPNLISRETVTELPHGRPEKRRDYDYLILPHLESGQISLDEFRVDIKSGDKFQTDEMFNKESSLRTGVERASRELAVSEGRPPAIQGFGTAWVYFYPSTQPRSSFRYLGEQKLGGQHTLVLAFAQKPASVPMPGMFRYQGKMGPMYFQGVAWVDPHDFRILRVRIDLLEPVPEVSLHRLTADIQFALTRIEDVPSPLELPQEVAVTYTVGSSTMQEIHKYSEYRLFRAQSKIVLAP